jgi:deazaflavin-dependent oxidoreductase (nitroreductase family)
MNLRRHEVDEVRAAAWHRPSGLFCRAAHPDRRAESRERMSDYNSKIIEEFRANDGKVGGNFAGAPLLLLHTTGAKSGQERINPVMYQQVPGGYAVFASKGGAPDNPDWFHNLLAHPRVGAEIGTDTVALDARIAEGDEREQIWTAQKAAYPGFAEYEQRTSRQIPVVVLEPAV